MSTSETHPKAAAHAQAAGARIAADGPYVPGVVVARAVGLWLGLSILAGAVTIGHSVLSRPCRRSGAARYSDAPYADNAFVHLVAVCPP